MKFATFLPLLVFHLAFYILLHISRITYRPLQNVFFGYTWEYIFAISFYKNCTVYLKNTSYLNKKLISDDTQKRNKCLKIIYEIGYKNSLFPNSMEYICYFSILFEKITFYTEILTWKVELWIFFHCIT